MQPSQAHIERARIIVEFISEHDNYLLSAHINADGDAVASVVAVHLILKQLGKKSVMVFSDQKIDSRFDYLKNFKNILHYSQSLELPFTIENAIILDVPGYGRLGPVKDLLPEKQHIAKIDHHPTEDVMGQLEWVDEAASSTTVMVYEVAEQSGITVDLDLAKAIFTGIVYDTGRFSFSNTTARDLHVCGMMVAKGIKIEEITNRIFFENSFQALKTIGKGLYSLEHYLDGMVNVIYLGLEDMSKNHHNEIEELANYSVAIRGGKIGLFIREIEPDIHKISFRSKSQVDVNQVAKAFDGGGHTRAAGCRIKGQKEVVIQKILAEIKKQL